MSALVTGGTRGIGLAITKALRESGYNVAVAARVNDSNDKQFYTCDLSVNGERFKLMDKFIKDNGGIDLLVNNAGHQFFAKATEYKMTQLRDDLALMLTAPIELSQYAAAWMLNHKGGHIINVLSTSAFQGARNILGYVTAKHGLLGATRTMAIEFAPSVHVNAVVPGLTETDMTKQYIDCDRKKFLNSITPAGRFCKPEEIADAVLFLAKSTAIYGQTVTVDGGWLCKNSA